MDPARNVVRQGSDEPGEQRGVSDTPGGHKYVVCEIIEEANNDGTVDGYDGGWHCERLVRW